MAQGTAPAPTALDLTIYSDVTRRAIYHSVVEQSFSRLLIEGEWCDPPGTADEAELQVLFLFGRWLATYRNLEAPEDAPENERRELLLVEPDSNLPEGFSFREI
jgi:hypothetical protein